MKLNPVYLLQRAEIRDRLAFTSYAILVTALFQLNSFAVMKMDATRVAMITVMLAQFYLTAYVRFPISRGGLRRMALVVFHAANFVVFREVVVAFSPGIVLADPYFEASLVLFFLLIVLGRDIRMYTTLAAQLSNLEKWSARKVLFEKPEKLEVHLGEAGNQFIHPNEILYIRTKTSGDHTKIFGVKSRKDRKFNEYETTVYRNFEEIGKLLAPFPQFKRISQSTVLNHIYPFEEKNGIITIEGRKFTKSKVYHQNSSS